MKHQVIHRDTTYIEFVAGFNTNATNNGEKYEAFKSDYGWLIIDGAGKRWQCPISILRNLIDTGELITQAHHAYTTEEKLAIGI